MWPQVYLYRGGFARFSAVRYSLAKGSVKDLYVHLTNVAIQKKVCTLFSAPYQHLNSNNTNCVVNARI